MSRDSETVLRALGLDCKVKASVIIPTRNRADVLASCLASLVGQVYPKDAFEVVVVDNGSTDHTRSIADSFSSSLQLVYIQAPEPGLHVARHEGMRAARADILIFGDDDIEATPTWVEAVVRSFEDSRNALVGGNNYPRFEADAPGWLLEIWSQPVPAGRALGALSILDFGIGQFEIDPAYVWGCNFSIRRDVLIEAGGFHPDAFPREHLRFRGDGESHVSSVIRRKGLRAMFNSAASVRHLVCSGRMTKHYFEQRAFAQGISDSYTAIRQFDGLHVPLAVRVQRAGARLRPMIRLALRSWMARAPEGGSSRAEVQLSSSLAYWRGYDFHRREVRGDPELLAWVLKEDYL